MFIIGTSYCWCLCSYGENFMYVSSSLEEWEYLRDLKSALIDLIGDKPINFEIVDGSSLYESIAVSFFDHSYPTRGKSTFKVDMSKDQFFFSPKFNAKIFLDSYLNSF